METELVVGILRWMELGSRERDVAEGKSNDVGEERLGFLITASEAIFLQASPSTISSPCSADFQSSLVGLQYP